MFEIDSSLKYIEASKDDVLEIIASINIPLVAAADHPSEPTKAYICSLRKPEDFIVVYIYLHLIQSNIGIIYKSTEGPTTEKDYPVMKGSALEFAESMGFLMEDLTYDNLNDREKEDLFNSLPLFMEDLSILKKKMEAKEEKEEKEEGEEEAISLEEEEEEKEKTEEKTEKAEEAKKAEEISLDEIKDVVPEKEEIVIIEEKKAPPPPEAKEEEKKEVKVEVKMEEPPVVEKPETEKVEETPVPETPLKEAKIDWENKEIKEILEPIIRFLASI